MQNHSIFTQNIIITSICHRVIWCSLPATMHLSEHVTWCGNLPNKLILITDRWSWCGTLPNKLILITDRWSWCGNLPNKLILITDRWSWCGNLPNKLMVITDRCLGSWVHFHTSRNRNISEKAVCKRRAVSHEDSLQGFPHNSFSSA